MTARDKTIVTAPQAWNTLAVKSQKTVDAYTHQIEEIMKIAIPMYKRIMHDVDGQLTEQAYGKEGEAIYSVSRHTLNTKLIELAENNSVNFSFHTQCLGADINKTKLNFKNSPSLQFDFIFGADGVGSVIRKTVSKSFPEINIVEELIDYGYKELTIPANNDGSPKLEKDA